MRDLELNKIPLWLVEALEPTEVKDKNGYYIGDITYEYSVPKLIYINVTPSTSNVVKNIFGVDCQFDKVACSTDIVLTEKSLLFKNEPKDTDYRNTYDYEVTSKAETLNGYVYGLKVRS